MAKLPDSARPAFDVSLVINVHRGRSFLARSMLSFEEAARFARLDGLRIEAVFVLDRSDPATANWVESYHSHLFDAIRVEAVDNGSLGLSRDQGLRLARGEYVLFGDEDDLISYNTIIESYRIATKGGPRCIVVPQYLFGFGTKHVLAAYFESRRVSPLAFFSFHPYVSRIFAHNSIKQNARFIDVPLTSGYAYEDWHFNATVYSQGYEFKSAPDTILFYRHRAGLLQNMNVISARQIPPTPLFEPATYLRICANAALASERATGGGQFLEEVRHGFLESPVIQALVEAARRIDPAIDLSHMKTAPVMSNTVGDLIPGAAYLQACKIVGASTFTDVLLADTTLPKEDVAHVTNVLTAIAARESNFKLLVVDPSQTDRAAAAWSSIPGAVTIRLAELNPGLEADGYDAIALRLIEHTAATSRLFLTPCTFSQRLLTKFGKLLSKNRKYCFQFDKLSQLDVAADIPTSDEFQFLSDHLDLFDAVLSCNKRISDFSRFRLDRSADKWQVLWRQRSSNTTLKSSAELPPTYRILLLNSGEIRKRQDLPSILSRHLGNADSRIHIDIIEVENTKRQSRNSHNLSYIDPIKWSDGAETVTHDAVIAPIEQNAYPDSDSLAGILALPHVFVHTTNDTTRTSKEIESGIIIETPHDTELAATDISAAILKLYRTPEFLTRVKKFARNVWTERHSATAMSNSVNRIFFDGK